MVVSFGVGENKWRGRRHGGGRLVMFDTMEGRFMVAGRGKSPAKLKSWGRRTEEMWVAAEKCSRVFLFMKSYTFSP
jgi:hypothetical protein